MLVKTAKSQHPLALSRRAMLRGLLGTGLIHLGLPSLEIMLNPHGDAFANGDPLPTRFGVWFWGNGVRPELWRPDQIGVGSSWNLSPELNPLSAHKNKISVITGAHLKTGTHPHHAGMTGVMTGAPLYQVGTTRDTIVSTFARQSIDMIAAEYYQTQTPLRSLELGITRFRGTDEGTTFQHLSHNGPNNPNPSEYSPRAVFERLFNLPTDSRRLLARRSVIDLVKDQLNVTRRGLGANDQRRLDQHLESLRALERRLDAPPQSCTAPNPPPENFPDINSQEQIEPQNEQMSALLALALSCDLTRVFSVQFSTCGSGVIVWQAGASNGLHSTTHDEPLSGTPETQPIVHAATTFTMGQLARFLDILDATPEGEGTLLDQCSILCTSEHTDGRIHSYEDFPLIIAGLGGGRLRGNVHYRSPNQESITRAGLTALRAGGVPAASFGVEGGYTEAGISDLEI